MKRMLALLLCLLSLSVGAQHVVDYGTDTNSEEYRTIDPSSSSVAYTSFGRDIFFLQHTGGTRIVVGNWGHCPGPYFPLPLGGKSPIDGTYDQLHHFNCATDTIDLRFLGYIHPDSVLWIEAAPGYSSHYLIINPGDSSQIGFGFYFRANRFYGTFDVSQNVLLDTNSSPFAIEFEKEEAGQPDPSPTPSYEVIYDMAMRKVAEGVNAQSQLCPGSYVRYRTGIGFDKIHKLAH